LQPASDNAQFTRPMIANRFPTPAVQYVLTLLLMEQLFFHRFLLWCPFFHGR